MTRAQLVQDLKNLVGPAVEVGDSGLITWINDAYLHICDEIAKVNPDFFTKSATASTLSGQQEYDLPDDFERVLMVNIQIDGEWHRARPMSGIGDIPIASRTDSGQGYSWSEPYYYIYGGLIGFMPIPDETTSSNIKLWYVYTPEELDADSDEPAIPSKYHHIIKYGAYANYLDQDDEHVAAERMRQRFDARIAQMIENMESNQVNEPRSVAVTTEAGLYYDPLED